MSTQKYISQNLSLIMGGLLTVLVLGVGMVYSVSGEPSSLTAAVDAQKPETCEAGSCIPLLAPLGDKDTIKIVPPSDKSAGGHIGTFLAYFQDVFILLELIAVGFCVLWILIGSFYIMVSGSDGGMRSTGKSIILWAVIGLILTEFAGFFLKTLNSTFFV